MNNEYTFIILSTISTEHSVFSREERFAQTLNTIQSIRQYAAGAKIVFIDNSIGGLRLDEVNIIRSKVDLFIDYENNLFSKYVSTSGHRSDGAMKGINELLLMEKALPIIKEHGLVNRRVFKISGRYRLTPQFNLVEYSIPAVDNRYVFKVSEWNFNTSNGVELKRWWDTRMWSFCGNLYQHYYEMMPRIFEYMFTNRLNLELSHTNCIPVELVLFKNALWVEGNMARGEYTFA